MQKLNNTVVSRTEYLISKFDRKFWLTISAYVRMDTVYIHVCVRPMRVCMHSCKCICVFVCVVCVGMCAHTPHFASNSEFARLCLH